MSVFAERFSDAVGLGQSAHDCLHEIHGQLALILDAIRTEDFDQFNRIFDERMELGANEVATVPQGQTWELELVSVDPDVAGAIRLMVNGRLRLALPVVAEGSSSGDSFILREGDVLTVDLVTAATADVFLQFNVKLPRPMQAIP